MTHWNKRQKKAQWIVIWISKNFIQLWKEKNWNIVWIEDWSKICKPYVPYVCVCVYVCVQECLWVSDRSRAIVLKIKCLILLFKLTKIIKSKRSALCWPCLVTQIISVSNVYIPQKRPNTRFTIEHSTNSQHFQASQTTIFFFKTKRFRISTNQPMR